MIEVITGCMFSGKTEELIRRIRRAQFADLSVAVFKPALDTRSTNMLRSHSNTEWPAIEVERALDILTEVLDAERGSPNYDVVAIDEVQFFSKDIIGVIDTLAYKGVRVIAAGLDTDFLGRPFGPMGELLAIADRVTKLSAVCMKCRSREATRSQRLIDGQPAREDSPVIMVGAREHYEARCRDCYESVGSIFVN